MSPAAPCALGRGEPSSCWKPGTWLQDPHPSSSPWLYSAIAATAQLVIYYLELPQGSFLIPPPLPPVEGSSLLMREADTSHWAANCGGLAGVTILTR